MMQKRSSLDENSKIQILSNDLERRLAHTDDRQDRRAVAEVVDSFGEKLLTSGYSLKQVRTIAMRCGSSGDGKLTEGQSYVRGRRQE